MSKCAPEDWKNTLDSFKEKNKFETPSWLRHKNKRGAMIDCLLLRGATMEELIEQSGSANERSVRGHLTHLQNEHKMPIVRGRGRKYIFDFDQQKEIDEQQPILDEWSNEILSKTPKKPQKPEELQAESTEIFTTPRADKQVHWGAVMLDKKSSLKSSLGKADILGEADNDFGDVLLAITGPNPETIKSAIDVIIAVAGSYGSSNHKTWYSGCLWDPSQYYVYRHKDEDGVFYVGKGIKRRGEEHVTDAVKASKAVANQVRTRKHQRILAAIQHESDLPDRLVEEYKRKSIQSYPMPMIKSGEMMAFLAEDFIITNIHGVYGLTNVTGGNSKSEGYTWLSQPKNSADSPGYWAEACGYFLEKHRLSSAAWAKLTKINADGILASYPDALKALREIDGIAVGEHSLIGQDVFIDVALDNMPFRIQLLFSSKNPTVKFNLRPARNSGGKITRKERIEFEEAYDKVSDKNDQPDWKIRIANGNDCYIKPFIKKDTPGRDPAFSILDLEEREAISLPSLDSFQEMNLVEAINYVRRIYLDGLTD
jgi:predicted GIY-YIG superfamily endonuclease